MKELFKAEKSFLKSQELLLSQMAHHDNNFTPKFFEENSNLIDEVIYIDIRNLWRQNKYEISEVIYKFKEGYYIYLSKGPNDTQYEMKIFFDKTKKYTDIIYQINRLNNINK